MALFSIGDVFGLNEANEVRKLWAGTTAPSSPGTGEFWLDTNTTIPILKRYTGSAWIAVNLPHYGPGTDKTISGGAITVDVATDGNLFYIDTEGGAASDNLDTINGGVDGQVIALMAKNDAHTVIIRDITVGAGNIRNRVSFSMDSDRDIALFLYLATLSEWICLSEQNNKV